MTAVMHAPPQQLSLGQARSEVTRLRRALTSAFDNQAEAAAFNNMLHRRLTGLSVDERAFARIAWAEALAHVKRATGLP